MIWFCIFQVVIMILFFIALNNMINSAIDEAVGDVVDCFSKNLYVVAADQIQVQEQEKEDEEHF